MAVLADPKAPTRTSSPLRLWMRNRIGSINPWPSLPASDDRKFSSMALTWPGGKSQQWEYRNGLLWFLLCQRQDFRSVLLALLACKGRLLLSLADKGQLRQDSMVAPGSEETQCMCFWSITQHWANKSRWKLRWAASFIRHVSFVFATKPLKALFWFLSLRAFFCFAASSSNVFDGRCISFSTTCVSNIAKFVSFEIKFCFWDEAFFGLSASAASFGFSASEASFGFAPFGISIRWSPWIMPETSLVAPVRLPFPPKKILR